MTDHQPEGTRLAAQLGDAVGGPEVPVPDPETETVDLRRKLWNVQRLGESMAGDRDETVRRCGEQVLAVLGDAALPVAAVLDPQHLQAALEALSIAVAGAEYEHQKKRYKVAWAYLDALEGKDGTEEGSAVVLCPTCLHDGVLERTLERAVAAGAERDAFREQARILGEAKAEWLCEPCRAIHPWRDGDRFTASCPDCGSLMFPTSASTRALRAATARVQALEGRLSAVAEWCRSRPELAGAGFPQLAGDILAIIGTEGDKGNG